MAHDFKALRLDKISRRFETPGGGVVALDGLSMEIARGEFIVLLGPSGCGKTTALNCIAGLLPLSSGSIWLDSRRIDVLPPERRGFGMVFQNYALFPHMTVRRNVGFGLKMQGERSSNVGRRVEHALDLVQLRGHEDKLPAQLSGGQQQRVAIARAIVIEPPLLLMDEPLSNLDAKLRLEMRSEIRRIHRELERSSIYVTHDQDEALSLADRIVVMKDGSVQQVAAPSEVYAQPANVDVARFMGFRNIIPLEIANKGANAGDTVVLQGWGLNLIGTARQPLLTRNVYAAIRPDELSAGTAPENQIVAKVENAEYCGRDYLVDVLAGDGLRLHARTRAPAEIGDSITLVAPRDRILVYPRDESANA